MTSREEAIEAMRIGAEPTPATANPGRPLGVAAVGIFAAMKDHKRYLLWALLPGGKTITEASDKEDNIKQMFADIGNSDTPWGDTTGAVYAAWWDTSKTPLRPEAEYAGSIIVSSKKKGKLGWILGGLAVLVGVGVAVKRKG